MESVLGETRYGRSWSGRVIDPGSGRGDDCRDIEPKVDSSHESCFGAPTSGDDGESPRVGAEGQRTVLARRKAYSGSAAYVNG